MYFQCMHGGDRMKAFRDVMREFVFGMEDGLVSNLGLVLGVYVGGAGSSVIVLAGLASMFAGAFSMSAGSYLSSKSQREVYEHEIHTAKKELKRNPKKHLREMKKILKKEKFDDDEVNAMLYHFQHHSHHTFVTNYIQKKVGLFEERFDHPGRSAFTMFFSFLIGSLFPVMPFVFLSNSHAAVLAMILTIVALLSVGLAKAHYTHRNWCKSGLEIVIVGIGAGIIGYVVGLLVGMV